MKEDITQAAREYLQLCRTGAATHRVNPHLAAAARQRNFVRIQDDTHQAVQSTGALDTSETPALDQRKNP
ncbi:MAG: hypothetical protein PHO92_05185 [Candidatus Peribacteraceae bacterium]|nr:hypothetical protein [Candidatus Peribacteraceae bacterium]